MKAFLLYRDRDFDRAQAPPPHGEALVQDLDLITLLNVMARGDKFLADIVPKAVLASATDLDTIRHRQAILKDCISQEAMVRQIYDLTVETIEAERKNWLGGLERHPHYVLYRSVQVMEMLVTMLRRLRGIAEQNAEAVRSEGFRTLFSMLRRELSDDYFAEIRRHLKQLKFPHGALTSARLGEGNKGIDYVLREENPPQGDWMSRLLAPRPPSYSFELHPRDEAGARALSDLRDKGINLVANALAQSTDHIVSFFTMLRVELAFYVGCLNLYGTLAQQSWPICFPEPAAAEEQRHSATELYDICLALNLGRPVVGNAVTADGKSLVIITGPNQGGKSTFLRAVGLAQLMMQCGMFVPAESFHASVCQRLFTHYKREEDAEMKSGKFDEELARMSAIIDDIAPSSLVLFNESFAATNEREGSEIGRQIVTALIEDNVRVFFVTHQYEFAHWFEARNLPAVQLLRAERREDGTRTFRITEGKPLRTSHGEDLYRQIFLGETAAARATPALDQAAG